MGTVCGQCEYPAYTPGIPGGGFAVTCPLPMITLLGPGIGEDTLIVIVLSLGLGQIMGIPGSGRACPGPGSLCHWGTSSHSPFSLLSCL